MLAFKRGERRYIADYGIKDLYRFYKEKKESKGEKPISYKLYKTIMRDFFCEVVFNMIYFGTPFVMPFRLGEIELMRRKLRIKVIGDKVNRNKIPVKWKETKEMWVEKYPNLTAEEIAKIPIEEKGLIYNWNEHTDRYRCVFKWNKISCNVPNKKVYRFKMNRTAKLTLNRALRENTDLYRNYYEQ